MLTGPGVFREEADDRFAITPLDIVVAAGNDPSPAKPFDILMLSPNLLIRTEDEFRQLFTAAGLRLTRVIPTDSQKQFPRSCARVITTPAPGGFMRCRSGLGPVENSTEHGPAAAQAAEIPERSLIRRRGTDSGGCRHPTSCY
jgi:hypothetical protein